QLLQVTAGDQGGQRDAAAGAPVQAGPVPDTAPGVAGDELLEVGREVVGLCQHAVDVRVPQHVPADLHPLVVRVRGAVGGLLGGDGRGDLGDRRGGRRMPHGGGRRDGGGGRAGDGAGGQGDLPGAAVVGRLPGGREVPDQQVGHGGGLLDRHQVGGAGDDGEPGVRDARDQVARLGGPGDLVLRADQHQRRHPDAAESGPHVEGGEGLAGGDV